MKRMEEIVHITPLGHEIDRAVKPFEHYKANRVYLLAVTETFDKYSQEMIERQRYYVQKVMDRLQKVGIGVEYRSIDMFDMLELLKNISSIIVEEKYKGNLVYVNISSAGRLTSAAATLAAMAHGVTAYYVSADRYSESTEDKNRHGLSVCSKTPRIQIIETFPLELPHDDEMKVLIKLCEEGKEMKTFDMVEYLGSGNVEGFDECVPWRKATRDQRINCLMKLRTRILRKLEKRGYIAREPKGKYNIIKITRPGTYIAHISGQLT